MTIVPTMGIRNVRNEFDKVFPDRDRSTDGWVSDAAHQLRVSGHNPDKTGKAEYKDGDSLDEVRAIDVDKDLVPGSKIDWMELVVQFLLALVRSGVDIPFRYIIYNRRIWSRSDGWKQHDYDGSNPHDKHAHFSGDYNQAADNWAGSLGLATLMEDDMEVADLNAALRDPDNALAKVSKAIAWQYVGGGIPAGMSTLGVLNAIHGYVQTIHSLVQMLVNQDDVDEAVLAAALAPAVAGLIIPALVTAIEANGGVPLTEAEVTEAVKAALRQGTV